MKKKIVSTLLCATMLAGMLAGCGGKTTDSTTGDTTSSADPVTEAADLQQQRILQKLPMKERC